MSNDTGFNLLKKLKICYLYLHADGELSDEEVEFLNSLVDGEDITDGCRNEFLAFCGRMGLKSLESKPETVIPEIDVVLGEKGGRFAGDFDTDKSLQADVIWTLLLLGCADKEYSAAEKEVVAHLAERWEMDPRLMEELNDSAVTLLMLERQKEWLQTTSRSYAQIKSEIEEIDQNINALFFNATVAICEANIA